MRAWRDLLASRTPGVRRAVAGVPALRRVLDALTQPPTPNRYVAPGLRRLDAVVFALRGYRVRWTSPALDDELDGAHTGTVSPSVLVYEAARWRDVERRHPVEPVLVELPTLIPGEVHRVASWFGSAWDGGLGFAWWRLRHELPWILKARAASRRRRRS